jgi:hypothetical protein
MRGTAVNPVAVTGLDVDSERGRQEFKVTISRLPRGGYPGSVPMDLPGDIRAGLLEWLGIRESPELLGEPGGGRVDPAPRPPNPGRTSP